MQNFFFNMIRTNKKLKRLYIKHTYIHAHVIFTLQSEKQKISNGDDNSIYFSIIEK